MIKKLIVFDDDTAHLLEDFPNQSQVVREATKLYIEHILPDTVEGMRTSYKILGVAVANLKKDLREVDSKLDYIAGRLK